MTTATATAASLRRATAPTVAPHHDALRVAVGDVLTAIADLTTQDPRWADTRPRVAELARLLRLALGRPGPDCPADAPPVVTQRDLATAARPLLRATVPVADARRAAACVEFARRIAHDLG